MSVSARAFNDWLPTVGLPEGASELSKRLGMKRTTLHNQRIRGRVAAATVVAAARAARVNPLDALAGFKPYGALTERLPVTEPELLSQVSPVDALLHLLSRIRSDYAKKIGSVQMQPIPGEEAVRNWVDAIDPGDLRRRISEEAGMSASNLSAQFNDNRLTPELAILAADLAGVSRASGLVVSGLITPEEADWPLYGRENALLELGDVELLDLVSDRLGTLRRQTKKKVDAELAAHNFLEALG